MARPFSIPAIPALAVGESHTVASDYGVVSRKVRGYASRSGKAFAIEPNPAGRIVSEREYGVRVTRLPDPEPRAECATESSLG